VVEALPLTTQISELLRELLEAAGFSQSDVSIVPAMRLRGKKSRVRQGEALPPLPTARPARVKPQTIIGMGPSRYGASV